MDTDNGHALKRVIVLGRKPELALAVEHLVERGISVPLLVSPDAPETNPKLHAAAARYGIPLVSDPEVPYGMIRDGHPACGNVDLVISYLYPKKIRQPLYALGARGCVNFHPAPLPDYKSRAGYNTAILDGRAEYGVSAHFIDSEEFDAGRIIRVRRFPFDPETETAHSLILKSQAHLFELFTEVIGLIDSGAPVETTPNVGGKYLTSKELEALKEIDPNADPSEIKRKIRAFFFPPYHGATITLNGHRYTLIDEHVLAYIARLIRGIDL